MKTYLRLNSTNQQSVGYIKKAIALGKDVNSLYGQFAKFFENSDTIHSANVKAQNSKKILTDGQIRAMSVQIAMQSKALRDAEKELKEMLIWSGVYQTFSGCPCWH